MNTFHMKYIGRFVSACVGGMCVRECSQFIAELTAKGIWCRRLSHISLLPIHLSYITINHIVIECVCVPYCRMFFGALLICE